MDNKQLLQLRKQIDDIDDKIIDYLEKRASIVEEVGEFKKNNPQIKNSNFIRSGREATMVASIVERLQKFPKVNGFEIWRNIITSSLKLEGGLEIAISEQDICNIKTSKAIFRYFGTSLPVKAFNTVEQAFVSVQQHQNQVGIAAFNSKAWVDMPNNIKIFAKIEDNTFVFAKLQPEKGLNDKTILLVDGQVTEIEGFFEDIEQLPSALKSSKNTRIIGSYSPLPV